MQVPKGYSSYFSKCDYSEWPFFAVAYWRIETKGEVETAFVTARTRVAPLKPMSVPRLELQAVVMGVRLAATTQDGHDVFV